MSSMNMNIPFRLPNHIVVYKDLYIMYRKIKENVCCNATYGCHNHILYLPKFCLCINVFLLSLSCLSASMQDQREMPRMIAI